MPAQQIQKGTTYTNYPAAGSQVTAENLNSHVDDAILLPGAITAHPTATPAEGDYVLAEQAGSLVKYTVQAIKDLFTTIFVPLAGGTMTGPLILNSSNPATAATAASKGYVDAAAAATVLPGGIMLWGTVTPPSGWLECNGQSTAGYPNLIALYGTNVPDLRGEFPRGWSHDRTTVDPGRTILSAQAQDLQPHTHSYTITGSVSSSNQAGVTPGLIPTSSSSTTGSTGTTETRPRNVALMFIIKT